MGAIFNRKCRSWRLKGEPSGYTEWIGWATKMSRTHKQLKCAKCGFYHRWEKKTIKKQEPKRYVWVTRDKDGAGYPFVWGTIPSHDTSHGLMPPNHDADIEALKKLVRPGYCVKYELRKVEEKKQ